MPEFASSSCGTVRADLEAVAPDRSPLAGPLTVFDGVADSFAPPWSLLAWQDETSARRWQCLFPRRHHSHRLAERSQHRPRLDSRPRRARCRAESLTATSPTAVPGERPEARWALRRRGG